MAAHGGGDLLCKPLRSPLPGGDEETLETVHQRAIQAGRKKLVRAEKRMEELDRLFLRLYEDNVRGKVSDQRYVAMSAAYEDEQAALQAGAQALEKEIEVQERQLENLEQFIQRGQYAEIRELTPYALRELVEAIYIETPDKSSGKRRQNIRIVYGLVGFIPLVE